MELISSSGCCSSSSKGGSCIIGVSWCTTSRVELELRWTTVLIGNQDTYFRANRDWLYFSESSEFNADIYQQPLLPNLVTWWRLGDLVEAWWLGGGLVAGWRLGGLVGAWWLGGGLVTWWGLGGFRNLVRLSTLVFLCSREPRLSSAQLRAE